MFRESYSELKGKTIETLKNFIYVLFEDSRGNCRKRHQKIYDSSVNLFNDSLKIIISSSFRHISLLQSNLHNLLLERRRDHTSRTIH